MRDGGIGGRVASVIWHEVECGGYEADLRLWGELADGAVGPILDLGCGTGRVALHLGRREHRALGLDRDANLVAAFNEQAGELPTEAQVGDAERFELGFEVGLVLAPMQLVQLFEGSKARVRCLRCVARHLAPGGLAAFAIVEEMPAAVDAPPPLPDTREVNGWVYSSLPIDAVVDSEAIRLRRLRQTVSPAGDLSEETDEVCLRVLGAGDLEREAERAGLRPAGRRAIPATADHVGSTIVLLEKEG